MWEVFNTGYVVIKCYVFMVTAVSVRSVHDWRITALIKKKRWIAMYTWNATDIIVLLYTEKLLRST